MDAWKSKTIFTTATATEGHLRLHIKCLDDHCYGYIHKWLDRRCVRAPRSRLVTHLRQSSRASKRAGSTLERRAFQHIQR